MAIDTQALPLLPLTTGVVLPGMVVTLTIESDEAAAAVEAIVESRGVPQVAEFLRGISDPGAIADTSGYSPDLSFEQKIEVLEALDVEHRLELVTTWARETLAEIELKDKIRTDVSEGM